MSGRRFTAGNPGCRIHIPGGCLPGSAGV